MIRIKVFSFRQAINNFLDILSIVLFITFTILVIIIFACIFTYNIKDVDASELSVLTYETFSKNSLMDTVLENEISVIGILSKKESVSDTVKLVSKNDKKNNNTFQNNNDINSNNSNISVKLKNSVEYTMPTKYEVEKYQNGNIKVGNAVITNYSKIELDLNELSIPSDFDITSENKFLIFHTHATESYTVPENPNIENYRTTDERYSIISVGSTLARELKSRGFDCIQDKTLHDYPSYNGAYTNSLNTVLGYLNKNKYDFIIDIHRDALSSNLNFRPTVEINGEKAAQLMFVIGTNSSGLEHAHWMENLKLALMIQNRANEMYPGLFRNINLSSSRYNQHISTGAFIIEVGATGNTLQDANNAMKYLAEIIDSFK